MKGFWLIWCVGFTLLSVVALVYWEHLSVCGWIFVASSIVQSLATGYWIAKILFEGFIDG